MDYVERIYKDEPLWDRWNVEKYIGKGNVGYTYKVSSNDMYGNKRFSVVKAIYINSTSNKQKDNEIIQKIISEVRMNNSIENDKNILKYTNHEVRSDLQNNGYNIYFKTDYLNSLDDYFYKRKNSFKTKEIIRMAIEICNVLRVFKDYGMIHKNINEDNIFIDKNNNFILADFAFSDKLLKRLSDNRITKKFSHSIAPESFSRNIYNEKTDIYSIGIVLYKLFNDGRIPLLPDYPDQYSRVDEGKAFKDRIHGRSFQTPRNANRLVCNIIMKACSFNPNTRYYSVNELKRDLIKVNGLINEENNTLISLGNRNSNLKIFNLSNISQNKTVSTFIFTFLCLSIIFVLLSANDKLQNSYEKEENVETEVKTEQEHEKFVVNFGKTKDEVKPTIVTEITPANTVEKTPEKTELTPSSTITNGKVTMTPSPTATATSTSEQNNNLNGAWSGTIRSGNNNSRVTLSITQNGNQLNCVFTVTNVNGVVLSQNHTEAAKLNGNSFNVYHDGTTTQESWSFTLSNGSTLVASVNVVDKTTSESTSLNGALAK